MGRHNRPSESFTGKQIVSGLAAVAIVLMAASVVVILLLTEIGVI